MNLKKIFNSFKFAVNGLSLLFRSQTNVYIHLLAAILALLASYYFDLSNMEWCLVVFCIGFVLVTETINTSIEYLTDLVSPEWNEKAGQVKDLAAGAVLLSSLTALIVGLFVFVPKIMTVLMN